MTEGRSLIVTFSRPTNVLMQYSPEIEKKVSFENQIPEFTHILDSASGHSQAIILYDDAQTTSIMRGNLKLDIETFTSVEVPSTNDIHQILIFFNPEFTPGAYLVETELLRAIVAENRFRFTPMHKEEEDDFKAAVIEGEEEARKRVLYLQERYRSNEDQITTHEWSKNTIEGRRRAIKPDIQEAEERLADLRTRSY